MTTKEFTIFIHQDEELSRKTREAFKQGCSARVIDDEEIAALPGAWSKPVTFQEGVALP
ncbi:MAG: hypothetical protein AAFS03_02005 [Pseudomonadota bacterium]